LPLGILLWTLYTFYLSTCTSIAGASTNILFLLLMRCCKMLFFFAVVYIVCYKKSKINTQVWNTIRIVCTHAH
jgi:hypothetical protein